MLITSKSPHPCPSSSLCTRSYTRHYVRGKSELLAELLPSYCAELRSCLDNSGRAIREKACIRGFAFLALLASDTDIAYTESGGRRNPLWRVFCPSPCPAKHSIHGAVPAIAELVTC